jgi:hypothetical protein
MPILLSAEQEEIVKLLCDDYKTAKQIALLRGTTVQAVYKTIKILIKKSVISGSLKHGFKNIGMVMQENPQPAKYYRLHGLQFDIQILDKSIRYEKLLKETTSIRIDNNTVVVYPEKIEVFSGQLKDFRGKDINECFEKAYSYYYDKLFNILENDLKIIIIKDRVQNIRLVRGHLAEVEGQMAKELSIEDNLIILRRSDGKQFFIFDKSFNMKESETVHPKHFKEDAHIIYENHLKSWVENPKCLNNAELSIKIDEIIELQRQTQIQLTDVVRLKKADMQSNTPQTETSKDKPFYVG